MPVFTIPYYFGLTERRHKGHGTRNPQGALLFLEDCIAPIGLQARGLGYSLSPSVTETRLWLQASDLLLTLYHSFPLFPKPPVFRKKTGGFDIFEKLFFVYSGAVFESEFHIAYAFSAATLRAFRYFPCMQSNPCSLINHKERDSPSLQICHCFPSRILYASPYSVVFPSSSII